jgi:hypothetical protein
MASSCASVVPSKFQSKFHNSFAARNLVSAVTVFWFLSCGALAQQQIAEALPDAPSSDQASSPPVQPPITVPAGTRLTLVLANSVNSRETRAGDQISAQVTVPVIINDQVAIPAGTYVQGRAQKLTRNGTQADMVVQSVALVFSDGYITHLNGPVNIESEEWTAFNSPSGGTKAAIIAAPLLGGGLGAALGEAAHTTTTNTLGNMSINTSSPKGVAIGSTVGLAAGAALSFILLERSHSFYLEEGAPMSLRLPEPMTLTQAQITDSAQKTANQPMIAVVQPRPPSDRVCYTPGSPGTPDVVIPGTPAIGDSPGTPSTVIPGTPATPPTPYPCP